MYESRSGEIQTTPSVMLIRELSQEEVKESSRTTVTSSVGHTSPKMSVRPKHCSSYARPCEALWVYWVDWESCQLKLGQSHQKKRKKEKRRFANHFCVCFFFHDTQPAVHPRAACVTAHSGLLLVAVDGKETSGYNRAQHSCSDWLNSAHLLIDPDFTKLLLCNLGSPNYDELDMN